MTQKRPGQLVILSAGLLILLSPAVFVGAQTEATPKESPAPSGSSGAAEKPPASVAPPVTSAPAPTAAATPAAMAAKKVRRTLFVAPFDNEAGQEQYDPVAAGLGDLVAVFLAQRDDVTVVERQQLAAITKEQALTLKGLTGQEYAVQAGKLLEADTVLVGRVYVVKNVLTVSARALEIRTARVLASEQLTCRPEDVLETSLQMARKLAEQMSLPLPEIDLKAVDARPIAALHFAKALSHYYAGDLDAAIMQFMQTIDLDPDYVEVHYWSGLCYYRQGEWPHAVIEWEAFLKRQSEGPLADKIKPMLAGAKKKTIETAPPRLAPDETKKPDNTEAR